MKRFLLVVLIAVLVLVTTGLQIEALNRGFESSFQMIYSDIKYGRDGKPVRQSDAGESTEKVKAANRKYDFTNDKYVYVEPNHPDIKNISKIVATYDYVYYEANSGTVKIHIKAYDMDGNEINSSFRKEMFQTDTPDVVRKVVTVTFDYSYEDLVYDDTTEEITYADSRKEIVPIE